jgi:hypothetical protein
MGYWCVALIPDAVPPSPKFQEALTGIGDEVLVKLATSLIQRLAVDENEVVNPPIFIGMLRKVSSHPAVLVVINVATKLPLVL